MRQINAVQTGVWPHKCLRRTGVNELNGDNSSREMFKMIGAGKLTHLRMCAIVAAIVANGPAMATDAANGARLAHRWCEACHVVSSTQRRPASDQAPPFATIANMPQISAAEIALYLLTPHPKMPDMNLTRTEANDLAAYITTLK